MTPDIKNDFSGIPSMAGFLYQILYYLKTLLSLKPDEEVSLELYDDVALESSEAITYFQLKHTTSGISKNLTKRDSDLWKTLYIWVKIIQSKGTLEEQKKWISKSKFVLVTSKETENNELVNLIQQYISTDNDDGNWTKIEKFISEQANKKKISKKELEDCDQNNGKEDQITKVSFYADVLDKFELKRELITTTEVITQDVKGIYKEISDILRYGNHIQESRIHSLVEVLLGRLETSFKDTILKGNPSRYSGKSFDEYFGPIFRQYLRQKFVTMPLKVTDPDKYLSSTFIKQLSDIGDHAVQEPKIVSTITQRLSFENDYNISKQDISLDDQQTFEQDIHLNWENHFEYYNGSISDLTSEQDIKKSAKDILYQIRNSKVNFVGEPLSNESVYGCYYYFSDGEHPTIGWRSDWKDKYNGEDFRKKWTID